jgi:membrane peptidoglycan carboxypeptidase
MPSIPGKKLDKPETYPFNIAVDVRRKVITLDLEKRVSQRKCHEYNMSIMNFGNNVNGIRNASNKYFSKELENLNESEILFLIKMLKSPTLYSSPKGKARLEYQIEQLIKRNKNKPNSVFKK